jgi:dihydropteroate synthase
MRPKYIWKLPRTTLSLGARTAVMGILNVTPDSFSDGGACFDRERAVARGQELEQEGADIIDIGGESTRPGSEPVAEDEEVRRVLPVIEGLVHTVKIPISVDTYRAFVARRAIEAGAQIVNDISGFRFDGHMPPLVRDTRSGVVLMHSRGCREALHKQPRMADPIKEVAEGLTASLKQAQAADISNDAIVIDPGIGFGKAAEESIRVLKNVNSFSTLGYPLLIGASRKSFMRSVITWTEEARDWANVATAVMAILNGVHIIRVHDVRQARVIADVTDRIVDVGGAVR